MITTEQRLADVAPLSPEEKVLFMLGLTAKLRDEIIPTVEVTERQQVYLDAVERAANTASRWAHGENIDGESILHPAYNDKGTDTWDTEVSEDMPEFSLDVILVGALRTNAALLAASTQLQREGISEEELPYPFDGFYDNDMFVEHIEHERARFQPRFQRRFDELWEARFRPAE